MSKLVIIGGGFAGVWAAMSAAAEKNRRNDERVEISLISKDDHLVIRPRLYEELSDKIRVPLIPLMQEIGVDFKTASIDAIYPNQRLVMSKRQEFSYDRLIVATGSEIVVPRISGVEHCFDVDTWESAQKLDRHYATQPENTTFIVIGASFAGLEIATEHRKRFGDKARIVLIDCNENATGFLGEKPRVHIQEATEFANIEQRLGQSVKSITPKGVLMQGGEFIESETVILATGMQASALTQMVNADRDEFGRLQVDRDLKVIGSDDIYAAGDTGRAYADDEHLAYMSCQHAIQLGRHAGHNALCDLLQREPVPYRQEIYRTCLDLGPWGALFTIGWTPEVQLLKEQGKAVKEEIVNNLIYPPSPDVGAEAIFQKISLIATQAEAAE